VLAGPSSSSFDPTHGLYQGPFDVGRHSYLFLTLFTYYKDIIFLLHCLICLENLHTEWHVSSNGVISSVLPSLHSRGEGKGLAG
jgi:hypothetical protein